DVEGRGRRLARGEPVLLSEASNWQPRGVGPVPLRRKARMWDGWNLDYSSRNGTFVRMATRQRVPEMMTRSRAPLGPDGKPAKPKDARGTFRRIVEIFHP